MKGKLKICKMQDRSSFSNLSPCSTQMVLLMAIIDAVYRDMTWIVYGMIVTKIGFLKFIVWKRCYNAVKSYFCILTYMHTLKRKELLCMGVQWRTILFCVGKFHFFFGGILTNSIIINVAFQRQTSKEKVLQECQFVEITTWY